LGPHAESADSHDCGEKNGDTGAARARHGPLPLRGVTMNVPPSLRPFTAGLYISSACAGGRMNVPGVVARAMYVAV
jgi:hypothetical protein